MNSNTNVVDPVLSFKVEKSFSFAYITTSKESNPDAEQKNNFKIENEVGNIQIKDSNSSVISSNFSTQISYQNQKNVNFNQSKLFALKLLQKNIFMAMYEKTFKSLMNERINKEIVSTINLDSIREYFLKRRNTSINAQEENKFNQKEKSYLRKKKLRLSKNCNNLENKKKFKNNNYHIIESEFCKLIEERKNLSE